MCPHFDYLVIERKSFASCAAAGPILEGRYLLDERLGRSVVTSPVLIGIWLITVRWDIR